MLHPQAKAFLDALVEQEAPGWEELSPLEGREIFSSLVDLFGQGPDVAVVESLKINDNVTARIYRPQGDGLFPAMVFFHGGGWVLGDLETHDTLCRMLANEANVVVVSVAYRLSPESVFPDALHDCYAAVQYVSENGKILHVDPANIIVAGDSAGANLAAAVAQMACKNQTPAIRMQILIYPVLDQACDSATYHQFAEGFGLTRKSMQWFWQQYLGTKNDGSDERISPLLAKKFKGLPTTHIITAQYDVLREEGEQYAKQLIKAGVPTTLQRYDGMIHGFVHFCGLFDAGREAISDIAKIVRSTCHGL